MTFPRLKLLLAACLLWLSLLPQPSLDDSPPVLSYGTQPVDWSVLRIRLDQDARWYTWASQQQPPTTTMTRRVSATGGGHRGYATAKECVSMVEHGGSYDRSSNPSHFGRYQFSRGTWAAYGGNPETWGSASPAEQDAVFETAWASPGGPSNWLPYDGCG